MFLENTLMLYQQDLQLGPYFVKSQPVVVDDISRVAQISN